MRTILASFLAIVAVSPRALQAQKESKFTDRLDAAAEVLSDMMKADDKGIPQDLLNKLSVSLLCPT